MSETMRHAIESGEKVKEELVLEQEDFLVNEVPASLMISLRFYWIVWIDEIVNCVSSNSFDWVLKITNRRNDNS